MLVPVGTGLAVMVLLALSFLLPTERMKAHVKNTADVFEKEGLYFTITGEEGSRHDNYIDALYLDMAIVGTQDRDLLQCVLGGWNFVHTDPADPPDNVIAAVTDPESVTLLDSEKRFFNGQISFLKPLLLVMGYTGVRMLCVYASLLGTILLGWRMYKRNLGKYILPVMLSILFLRLDAVWMNLSFTGIYMCMLIPCLVFLRMKRETLRERAWLLFGIIGSATFCFNMNYFQLLSFGMPLLLYLLVAGLPEKPLQLLKTVLDLFVAWMIGYAGAMVFKWAVYSVVTGESIFGDMVNHALWRSGVDEGSRMETIMTNARIAFGNIWWDLMEFGFIGYILVQGRKKRVKLSVSAAELLLLLVMILIPVGRLAVLANHSMHHAGFVYRVFMMPVLAFNLLLAGKRNPG